MKAQDFILSDFVANNRTKKESWKDLNVISATSRRIDYLMAGYGIYSFLKQLSKMKAKIPFSL
jgi:hypothetical protein